MFRVRVLCVLSILVFCFVAAIGAPVGRPGSESGADGGSWEALLSRGLFLFYEGRYEETFSLLEQAVRKMPPGPGVHRCLGLLRKSFSAMHDQQDDAPAWNASAQEYIRSLGQVSDPDIVLAALLAHRKQRNATSEVTSEALLDKLMEPSRKSPWLDWAYWEKARVVASKIWIMPSHWGEVEFVAGLDRRLGCLINNDPALALRGRAAEAFLKQHPDTYMGHDMRIDLCLWRTAELWRGIGLLQENRWYVGTQADGLFPLNDHQIQLVAVAKKALIDLQESFPAKAYKLADAERHLDEFLWGESGKKWILTYLDTVVDVKGRQSVPAEVVDWLAKVARPEERETIIVPEPTNR